MAVISTPEIDSIAKQIFNDFDDIKFCIGNDFHWSPTDGQVHHPNIIQLNDVFQLLHEIGHARLGHSQYPTDITLLEMERQAWEEACSYASNYDIPLDMNGPLVQSSLDSYRQWLHSRSTCPNCEAVGVEQRPNDYLCILCHQHWKVNEARTCRLRRYKK